ncbi:hypothetical protein BJV82DRAFT_627211 [Fennellomyces sp. T-0311]|nr:hypothetical protein BJV82DRAFT_627211 [Fennellomyces sp. T-0311]
MFSNIVNNIRDKFTNKERKSSVDDEHLLHKTLSTPSSPMPRSSVDEQRMHRKLSVPDAIPVQRRRSTLFGISNVSADDYMQKDLISSSWS